LLYIGEMRFVAMRPPAPAARVFLFPGQRGRNPASAAWLGAARVQAISVRPSRRAQSTIPPRYRSIHVLPSTIGEEATCARLEIPKEACCASSRLARASPARGQRPAPAPMGDRSRLPGQEARRTQVDHRAAAAQGQAGSGLSSKAPPCRAHQEPAQLLEDAIWDIARGLRRHADAPGPCLRHLQETISQAALRRPLPRDPQGARPAVQEVQLRTRTFQR